MSWAWTLAESRRIRFVSSPVAGVPKTGAFAAGFDQQRQTARVVQVGVGQQHGIQFAGIQVARDAVSLLRFGDPLKQAEIDQNAGLLRLDQISRTGDVAAGSTM